MTAVVELAGLRRTFGKRAVLDGLELSVAAGELVAIVGASGSGKTTLLNVMGALDATFEGQAALFGQPLRGLDDDARSRVRSQTVGFVFQSFHLLEHLSVLENVKVPLWLLDPAPDEAEADRRALAALTSVGLGDRVGERIGPLSGGERQRVAIARAVVHAPKLVLADEPTGNLDSETGASILDVFDQLRKDAARAVVIVTHDPRVAPRADRVLALQGGKLVPVPKGGDR